MLLPLRTRASRWIDLCRPAAGNHAGIGMRADNRDGMDFRAIEREHAVFIFEQHRALLGETARCFKAALHIHNALLRGVVDDPAGKFGTQDASYMVVELGGRDLARLYGFFELFPEKLVERFFIV